MPTSIRLPTETEARLNHLAAVTGRTKAYYIRKAIEEKLEDLEDIYIAEQIIENGGLENTSTLDEVMARLGIKDDLDD